MQRIATISVGLLGSAGAARPLQSGVHVMGYDTPPEQVAALAPLGLCEAASLAEAVADAKALCTMLPSLESVEAAICGSRGLIETVPHGAIVIQMSTISPALPCRLYSAAMARGLGFLDAPISDTSAMVARGDCAVFVGGDATHVQVCQPLFDAVAPKTVHVGAIGMASLAKLATNLLAALNTAALAEALVLAAKGGLAPATMLEVLQDSAASSRMLDVRGPLMAAWEFPPQMKLDLFLKDLRLMLEEGQRLSVPLPLASTAQHLYTAAAHAGAGAQDLAVVITQLAHMAGLTRSPQ